MAKNKQSSLIAIVKILNIGLISKYIINLAIGDGRRGLLSIIKLPITSLKYFPLHPQLFFSIKYRRYN